MQAKTNRPTIINGDSRPMGSDRPAGLGRPVEGRGRLAGRLVVPEGGRVA